MPVFLCVLYSSVLYSSIFNILVHQTTSVNGREHSLEYARFVSLEFTHSPRCFGRACLLLVLLLLLLLQKFCVCRLSFPIHARGLGISPLCSKCMSISTAYQVFSSVLYSSVLYSSIFNILVHQATSVTRIKLPACPVSRPVTDEVSTI